MMDTDVIVAIISPVKHKELRKMPAGGCVWGIFDGYVEGVMRLVCMRPSRRRVLLFLEDIVKQ